MALGFKALWDYKGMFEKCYLEPGVHGWGIFDRQNEFVGFIYNHGFGINSEYEYCETISRELIKRGVNVFDYDTHEEIKNEQALAELMYNHNEEPGF